MNLQEFITSEKITHVSIEDAGWDKTSPISSIQRLYDDDDIRDLSVVTSVLNLEFERMLQVETE